MKIPFLAQISLACIISAPLSLICQTRLTHNPWRPFLESRQGDPGKPDVVDHKRASKGANLVCYLVESNPKNGDDGQACRLGFSDGSKHTLKFDESIQVPKDDEISLVCLGDKPTRCKVGIWFDTPADSPQ